MSPRKATFSSGRRASDTGPARRGETVDDVERWIRDLPDLASGQARLSTERRPLMFEAVELRDTALRRVPSPSRVTSRGLAAGIDGPIAVRLERGAGITDGRDMTGRLALAGRPPTLALGWG